MGRIIKTTEKELNEALLEGIELLLIESHFKDCNPRKHTKEIVYFSPDGKSMPNGVGLQRGGFLMECRHNANSFILNEEVHGKQYGLAKYRGGVIVFSTDVNAIKLDANSFKNKVKQIITTFQQRYGTESKLKKIVNHFNKFSDREEIGAYSVGNAFSGKYVGDNGEHFDERSKTIEVNGLSTKGLLWLAELIARMFHQETVLVKDFNANKFYLANGRKTGGEPDLSGINTEC